MIITSHVAVAEVTALIDAIEKTHGPDIAGLIVLLHHIKTLNYVTVMVCAEAGMPPESCAVIVDGIVLVTSEMMSMLQIKMDPHMDRELVDKLFDVFQADIHAIMLRKETPANDDTSAASASASASAPTPIHTSVPRTHYH